MFKIFSLTAAAVVLAGCSGFANLNLPEIPQPPAPVELPNPGQMDNTELCEYLARQEQALDGWVRYGEPWAKLLDIDLREKLDELTEDIQVLDTLAETRNILCVTVPAEVEEDTIVLEEAE